MSQKSWIKTEMSWAGILDYLINFAWSNFLPVDDLINM